MLAKGNWQQEIYQRMGEIMLNHQEGDYAVFDWDNTCIINDIGEAVFNYQLRHLAFDLTPAEIKKVLLTDLPNERFTDKWQNQAGEVLRVEPLAIDIVTSYERLFQDAQALNGRHSLEVIQKTTDFLEFTTKLRFLYDAIGESFSPDISYPWVTYFLGGKTAPEIQRLTEATLAEELQAELIFERWTSPATLDSQSGSVSIQFKRGIRVVPEVQELMKVLEAQGITVYIVSASNRDVILTFATESRYGYGLSTKQIYGMRLKRESGSMLPELDDQFVQTQGGGKTTTIRKLIAPLHDNRGPLLVAGDSDGDVAMLSDFPDTELALIIDRQKKGEIGLLVQLGKETVGKQGQRFFVQARDETLGSYLNQMTSILLKE